MAGGRSGLERARRRHVYEAWHRGAKRHEVTSGGASFVAMVQTADFWKRDYLTLGDRLHGRGVGASFASERCVRAV